MKYLWARFKADTLTHSSNGTRVTDRGGNQHTQHQEPYTTMLFRHCNLIIVIIDIIVDIIVVSGCLPF